MKKEIITGITLLGTLVMAQENGETTKDPIYRVVPRKSSVIVKDKKATITNNKAMCSADRVLSKTTEGKSLRDVKCSPSKTDPNYNYWKKVAAMKNIKIYDKDTQNDIIKEAEDIEEKYKDAHSKYEHVVGADRLHFDLVEIKPKPKEEKVEDKKVKGSINQLIRKGKLLMKEKKNPKKVYVNDKKEKKNSDSNIDSILKNYAEKLSKNF